MKHKTYNRKVFHVSRFTFHECGFTVMEVLIAGAVIAIVSSIVLANVGVRRTDLTRAAQKLALDLREAQNLSLAPTDQPLCVYGVRVTAADSYFIYKNPDAACAGGHNYDAGSVTIKTITLEPGVIITPAGPDLAVPVDIAFEPPEPITYLNNASAFSEQSFTLSAYGQTRAVRVNRFGRVEIQ